MSAFPGEYVVTPSPGGASLLSPYYIVIAGLKIGSTRILPPQ